MADNITPRGFVVGTKRADEPAEATFFGISTSSGIRDTNKDAIELPYIIYQWCNKDNGVIDLLYTAHILFGRPNKEPVETAVIVVSD